MCGPRAPPRFTHVRVQEDTVNYLKPWTTLIVGIAIGHFIVPKILARVGG
jgi:hypothetical protein